MLIFAILGFGIIVGFIAGWITGTQDWGKRILYGPGDDDAYAAQRATLFADFLAPCVPGAVAVADLGTGHAAALARRIFLDLQVKVRPRWRRDEAMLERLGI